MICTFESTFCTDCVDNVLKNVCPNCGGGFEKRTSRPKNKLDKNPVSTEEIYKPVDVKKYKSFQDSLIDIAPRER